MTIITYLRFTECINTVLFRYAPFKFFFNMSFIAIFFIHGKYINIHDLGEDKIILNK